MQGRVVSPRVFLEGIEIDVASVRVGGGVGQPATATLEIPAADAVHRLLPRTLVHVFYCESSHILEDPTNRASPEAKQSGDPGVRKNWRLLFAGELMQYHYTNAGGSRQAVLVCQDFSSYWEAAKLYWGSNNTALHSYKTAIAAGATQAYSGKKQVNSSNALLNLLLAKPATNPRLTGLLGGVVALLEAATGVFHPDAKKQFRGVNDFMSQAELRLHLTHMIAAAPDDTTSAKFLNTNQFRQYIQRVASSTGSQASFSDLLNLMLGRVYYSWASVLAPPYFPQNSKTRLPTKQLVARKAGKVVDADLRGDNDKIKQLYDAAQARYELARRRYGYSGDPKTVDRGGDPLRYKSYTDGQSATAEIDGPGHVDFAAKPIVREFTTKYTAAYWRARAATLRGRLTSTEARERFDQRMGQGYEWAALAAELLKQGICRPFGTQGYAEHTTANFQKLRSLLEKASDAWGGGLGGGGMREVDADLPVGDRLNCHLLVPDLYMVPPPTCNVLFPDHYHSLQFSRQWMSEMTRLLLHTKTASGRDVKNIYFAPTTDILLDGPAGKTAMEAVKQGLSFLMPHELYTGPIVGIEGIGDSTIFRKIDKEVAAKQKKADPQAPLEQVKGEALYSPQEHLQRAANYLFFSKRFEGRSMVVQARFCPQVVVGLPMLVLDPAMTGATGFGTGESVIPKGTHFLGLVVSVQHSINAQGEASSVIQLSKCREHREGIDIFDPTDTDGNPAFAEQDKKIIRAPGSRKKQGFQKFYLDSPEDLPFRRSDGTWRADPNRPIYVETGTVEVHNPATKTVPKPPAGYRTTYEEYHPKGSDDLVASGTTTEASVDAGKTSVSTAGSKTIAGNNQLDSSGQTKSGSFDSSTVIRSRVVHLPVEVYEAVPRKPTTKKIKFNFEETATPPWFSDIYLPYNIGKKFYRPMLGCGSVLDESPLIGSTSTLRPIDEAAPPARMRFLQADGSYQDVEIPAGLTIGSMSVQEAAGKLAEAWKGLTEKGADMSLFVDAYCTRSYATLTNIMGNQNKGLTFRPKHLLRDTEDAAAVEGFHGNAYGLYRDLKDYAGVPLHAEPLVDSVSPDTRTVAGSVDPRAERCLRVREYVDELAQHH